MKITAPTAGGNQTSITKQFLLFGQGGSLFGIELEAVREVLSLKEQPISLVPNTLPFLLGLTN
ncbi:chemotaxis protein CheW, partial [Microcoleus sp. FACHB-DQ6]|nr:chemotaxis protein CheW [Microcoleus sp. FACHB-DQ6]